MNEYEVNFFLFALLVLVLFVALWVLGGMPLVEMFRGFSMVFSGVIYLIHFDRPIGNPSNPRGQAKHYIGYTKRELGKRLSEHRNGSGGAARIMEVLKEAGVGWMLVRTWHGDRSLERQLKDQHHNPRLCPICNPKLAKYLDLSAMMDLHKRDPGG